MTVKKQWMYIAGLTLVFLVVIPVILLYSFGYRLSSDFRLVKTGGIYCSNDESDVSVYLNGKLKKSSGMIERNILVQNIKPGSYHVKVVKDGYRLWQKWIRVHEQKVEVCFPLLLPKDLNPEEIPKYLPIEGKPKKKPKRELNDEYQDIQQLFKKADKSSGSIFPTWNSREIAKLKLGRDRKLKGKVFLSRVKNRIYARWIGKKDRLPFFINTMKRKRVFSSEKAISSFEFYPNRNDAFIVRFLDGTLYAVEIDTRFGIQNLYRIVNWCDRFIVDGEMLFYFKGRKLYKINFER